jgi:6-phosphofructokinase
MWQIIVDYLHRLNINILFCIGGDGTIRAAEKITAEITRRNFKIAVIGIPKTIDNDLHLIQKSFGFDTAIEKAADAIKSAHVEARGMVNGIGLIKIMDATPDTSQPTQRWHKAMPILSSFPRCLLILKAKTAFWVF